MDLNDFLESQRILQNSTPIDDFFGFSANEMNSLIYHPLMDDSAIRFQKNISDETLNAIPFFRLFEDFLQLIHKNGFVKLTPLGATTKPVLVELYLKKHIDEPLLDDGMYKPGKEDYCYSVKTARIILELSSLAKKQNGKLLMTKKGIKLLETNNRFEIFKECFTVFAQTFLWAHNDGHKQEGVGQFNWAFSIFIVKKFGNQNEKSDFFAKIFREAFPMIITHAEPPFENVNSFNRCYNLRFFERFALWFGLVNIGSRNSFLGEFGTILETGIIDKIFVFDN